MERGRGMVSLTAERRVIVDTDAAAVVTAQGPNAAVGPACFRGGPAGTPVLVLDVGIAVAVSTVLTCNADSGAGAGAGAGALGHAVTVLLNLLPTLPSSMTIVGGGGVRKSEKSGGRRALRLRGDRPGAAPVRQEVVGIYMQKERESARSRKLQRRGGEGMAMGGSQY